MIEVLLHRLLPAEAVIARIRAALRLGSTSAEVVAVEARRAASRPASQRYEQLRDVAAGSH